MRRAVSDRTGVSTIYTVVEVVFRKILAGGWWWWWWCLKCGKDNQAAARAAYTHAYASRRACFSFIYIYTTDARARKTTRIDT